MDNFLLLFSLYLFLFLSHFSGFDLTISYYVDRITPLRMKIRFLCFYVVLLSMCLPFSSYIYEYEYSEVYFL